MSIFSKPFPGTAKGEAEASSPPTSADVDGDDGPTMKRSTNDVSVPAAPRPEPQANKTSSGALPVARVSGARTQVGLGPTRPQAAPAASTAAAAARAASAAGTRGAGVPSTGASGAAGAGKALAASPVVVVRRPEQGANVAQSKPAATQAGGPRPATAAAGASSVAPLGAALTPRPHPAAAAKLKPPAAQAPEAPATRERPPP